MSNLDCSRNKFCTLCHLEEEPVLHLRGSCPEVGLDLNYTMKLDKTREGRHDIFGWGRTKIVWNKTRWTFFDVQTEKEVAYTDSTTDSTDYPIGVHKWFFVDGNCKDSKEGWREMNLHACRENEFMCQSGDCVDLKKRCDRNYHCTDLSDEHNCTYVKTSDYDKSCLLYTSPSPRD